MQWIEVTGGQTLQGKIRPATAKNSVLPLLAATLLCEGPCRLCDVPQLRDVDTSLALLHAVGGRAWRCGKDIQTRPATTLNGRIPPELAGAMRGSVFYLAPLLCRAGQVSLPLPGGCHLGPRPVDIHLAGLAAMGAQIETEGERVLLRRNGPLHATDFTLRLPSVGATLTLMMAACLAAGTTILRGVACEPEIEDTAMFLNACGGCITGAGTPVMTIRGQESLHGAMHTPLPDRIAAATYAAGVAVAGGKVCIQHCRPAHFESFLQMLVKTGCEVETGKDQVTVSRDPAWRLRGGAELYTAAYPEFATDTAPLAAAVLLGAHGSSSICDRLFQNRFACAEGFSAMGAETVREGRTLKIAGDAVLRGAEVEAPDLRGGAALVVAALGARGTVRVRDEGHIRRGYAHLAADFSALGADCRETWAK